MKPEPSGSPISQRDIARLLGISQATVSMALKNSDRLSEKLREEVKQKAEELGYRPDPMLSVLSHYRKGKSNRPIQAVIGWINAWQKPEKLREFIEFDYYWKGASAVAKQYGYRLEEFRLNQECTPQRLHQILSTRGIRGLLLPPHPTTQQNQRQHPEWEAFPWSEYSIIRFGRSLQYPPSNLVTADQAANTILAFMEIRKRGYRRIGFVTDEKVMWQIGHMFESGFLSVQRMVDESERVPVFVTEHVPTVDRKKALALWIKKNKVDAILTNLHETPTMLEEIGVKVPDDIGLAGTTVHDISVDAGIDQHPEEIGRAAMVMLNSLINDCERGVPKIFRQLLVEGAWVDGASLPPKIPPLPLIR